MAYITSIHTYIHTYIHAGINPPHHSEVSEPHRSVAGQQQVARLDVSVDEALAVQVGQARTHALRHVRDHRLAEAAARVDPT